MGLNKHCLRWVITALALSCEHGPGNHSVCIHLTLYWEAPKKQSVEGLLHYATQEITVYSSTKLYRNKHTYTQRKYTHTPRGVFCSITEENHSNIISHYQQ